MMGCSAINTGDAVLDSFRRAVRRAGYFPNIVRMDHGGENVLTAAYAVKIRNIESAAVFGKSTSNTRIERIWLELREHLLDLVTDVFRRMERTSLLDVDVDSAEDLRALQGIFVPLLQKKLDLFRSAFNSHKISTAGSRSPHEMHAFVTARNSATALQSIMDLPPTGQRDIRSLCLRQHSTSVHFSSRIDEFAEEWIKYLESVYPSESSFSESWENVSQLAVLMYERLRSLFQSEMEIGDMYPSSSVVDSCKSTGIQSPDL